MGGFNYVLVLRAMAAMATVVGKSADVARYVNQPPALLAVPAALADHSAWSALPAAVRARSTSSGSVLFFLFFTIIKVFRGALRAPKSGPKTI